MVKIRVPNSIENVRHNCVFGVSTLINKRFWFCKFQLLKSTITFFNQWNPILPLILCAIVNRTCLDTSRYSFDSFDTTRVSINIQCSCVKTCKKCVTCSAQVQVMLPQRDTIEHSTMERERETTDLATFSFKLPFTHPCYVLWIFTFEFTVFLFLWIVHGFFSK